MNKLQPYILLLSLSVFCLLLMGILAIYSTTYLTDSDEYLHHQLVWVLVGLIAALTIAFTPMDYLSRLSKLMLLGVTLLLFYLVVATYVRKIFGSGVRLPFVVYAKGASRWVGFRGISVQPSEFAKFALILFFSTYYGTRDRRRIEDLREGLLMPGAIAAVVMLLIVLGRALSNTLLCGLIVFSIMFVAGVRTRRLLPILLLVGLLGVAAIALEPYRMRRITSFVARHQTVEWTTAPPNDSNHQLKRSICAIGSGGIRGLGLSKGRLKNKAIPESQTDFIFAVIGEEFGFIGILFGISMYVLFFVSCLLTGEDCREAQGKLICFSVGLYVTAQALFNLSVICGILPTTGVTAPLVSYGGSSIVSVMMCVGLVVNVIRANYQEHCKEIVVEPADIVLQSGLPQK